MGFIPRRNRRTAFGDKVTKSIKLSRKLAIVGMAARHKEGLASGIAGRKEGFDLFLSQASGSRQGSQEVRKPIFDRKASLSCIPSGDCLNAQSIKRQIPNGILRPSRGNRMLVEVNLGNAEAERLKRGLAGGLGCYNMIVAGELGTDGRDRNSGHD